MPPSDMEVLGVRESLSLLGSVPVGRLVFTENALPAIRPVNFAVADDQIVLHATAGSWARRLNHVVVAFEVDEIDADARTGWSVVVIGRARLVTDAEELAELRDVAPPSWAPGSAGHFLSVAIEQITGRRLVLRPA